MSEHPENIREKALSEWQQNLKVPNYKFLKFLSNESALLK